jgi:hypothetical protein
MPLKSGNATVLGVKGPGISRLGAFPFIQKTSFEVKKGVTI